MTKVLYIDLDNVLVDFPSGIARLPDDVVAQYTDNPDEAPGVSGLMDPMPGAIEAYTELADNFDAYILSTSPWKNPSAWSDKLLWVHKYFRESAYKRLILSHHKKLNEGDFIIDDRTKRGVDKVPGEHIHFGSESFPGWPEVMEYLRGKAS